MHSILVSQETADGGVLTWSDEAKKQPVRPVAPCCQPDTKQQRWKKYSDPEIKIATPYVRLNICKHVVELLGRFIDLFCYVICAIYIRVITDFLDTAVE